MVYIIEISFIAKKVASVECVLSELTKLGDWYNCIEKYHICESKSKKYNYDTVYVYTCKFNDEQDNSNNINCIYNFSEFIKEIKKRKIYNVDIITNEDIKCDIIYVSPYYLKNMMYEERNEYIKTQRNRSYSETEYLILKQFKNELSKYNNDFVEKNASRFNMSYDKYLNLLNSFNK